MEQPRTETPDYIEFKQCVLARTGIDLNLYKHQQMHRRLRAMVDRAHASGFMEYFRLLERDNREFEIFLDRITINVSELFRNREKWDELRDHMLPPLLSRKRSLRVWSAGCSYGAEPYSLALLLAQLDPGTRHSLYATDIDRTVLARAGMGTFTTQDVRNVDEKCLASYFRTTVSGGAGVSGQLSDLSPVYQVNPGIRERVRFSPHNLLADRFDSGYDLICCRNVVIYFTDAAKDRLFDRFFQALAPGGVLFVGGTERIFRYREIGFECPAPFFYRRPD